MKAAYSGSGTIPQTIEFPKNLVILGNLALAIWIILDSIGIWLVNQAAGWIYLVIALLAVYGALKFLGCLRPCYNCKKCTFGMGRLSALFFGKRSLKDYKENYHLPTALFFYTFIGPFPAAILIASTLQELTILKVALAIPLLTLTFASASTWRSKSHATLN